MVTLLDNVQVLGIAFVSLAEGIDATTPAGRLQLHILGAIAEFERGRIQERVMAGLARARAQGKKLGRRPVVITGDRLDASAHLSLREAAKVLGVSHTVVRRNRLLRNPIGAGATSAPE